ncbi:response regulator [Paenibacillus arenosi]|uniref:Response regulator n=1 Tax=Paenibacillus arenosi TaxID=2774142 RepID=A0ABR9AUM4_9BACL|nr:response regulator [Paenibacillus arenosi]MBD8497833.1 response regulator [Paenibacillus arenosi]
MYKVLLADDEVLDLEGMRQFIPWSELGLEVVGAVNNGFSAYELIQQQPVDILVTDVHMPNMSGLELARRALEHKQDMRVIFVSGYQDFQYVKQALSMNACSYVLKPMDDEELIQSLNKVTKDLNEDKRRKEAEENYEVMRPMAKNELMTRLLEGDYKRLTLVELDKLSQSVGLHKLQWPLQVAVVEVDDARTSGMLGTYSTEEKLQWQQTFSQDMQEVCHSCGTIHSCQLSKQRLAILMTSEHVANCMHAIVNQVQAKYSFTFTVGIGEAVHEVDQLSASYQQAIEAVEGKMFLGKGKVIPYMDVKRTPEMEDARTLDIRVDAMCQAISEYDLVRIHDEIDNLFRSVASIRSKFTVHNLALYLVMKLDQHLQSMDEDVFRMLGMQLHNLDILQKFETTSDIRSWLVRQVFYISETLQQKSLSKNSRLIREIIKVMEDNLHENIALKDIALQFSFSPNYLGFLFKEEVGKSFSEMLFQLRMERAKELLKDPSMKIYEVANQVGYRYLPYFSRQFKETYGTTPMEFRKKL